MMQQLATRHHGPPSLGAGYGGGLGRGRLIWMQPGNAFWRYAIALIATLIALLLRMALAPVLKNASPFLLFALAVMVSAWFGGLGPGLLSTAVGAAAADYFLLKPVGFSHTTEQLTRVGVFVLVGSQISWLSGALHRAKRRAEQEAEAARRGEQLYRTLAANFPHGIVCLFDRDLRWTVAEGAGLAEIGLSGEHLGGKRIAESFPPNSARLIEPICRQALETVSAVSEEVLHAGRVYLVQALPLGGTSTDGRHGDSHAGMAIMQDVTDRVRAREALEQRVRERTSELNFQKTLLESQSEASRDAIVAVSNEGHIIFSNQRFEETWGYVGRDGSGWLEDVRRGMARHLAEPSASDPLGTGAERRGRPDDEGSEDLLLQDGRTLERYSAPIISNDGTCYGRVWFFRDVTERKRLEREILEAGERERRRIGQDLHDDLCQQLSGIACLGRVLQRQLKSGVSDDAVDQAGEIAQLVQQAAARARDLAKGLQPMELATDGLDAALAHLCASVEAMFQVSCDFHGEGDARVANTAAAVHLYRIAQEAIHNAVRHARAGHISVDLVAARGGGRVVLTVEDDGVGIPDVLPRDGLGLHTMSFRARMIGASLSVERGDSGGTVVTCSMLDVDTAQGRGPAEAEGTRGSSAEHWVQSSIAGT